MSHKAAFEVLDKTLQDICGNESHMGGVTFMMAGDFRQTVPVVPQGTWADEMCAYVKSSYLWCHFTKLSLSTNMTVHLHGNQWAGIIAKCLLLLSNGKVAPVVRNSPITMKGISTVVRLEEEMRNQVFPNLQQHFRDHKWLCERVFLSPKNEAVLHQLNLTPADPRQEHLCKSIDTITDTSETVQYPVEFLNSLELPGVPQHRLLLKVGAPIIFFHNLDPPKLCNGTRLMAKQLLPHVTEVAIIIGNARGKDVFIPRIPINPSDLPFELECLQFPVCLSFAMAINKSQGQSLKIAVLNHITPAFPW